MAKRLRIYQRILLGLALAGNFLDDVVGSGARAYSARKLWFWTPPNYKDKNYQEVVWRMPRTDQIEKKIVNGKPVLSLGKTGRKLFKRDFNLLNWQNKPWDKKWRLVIFDLPKNKKTTRDQLRRKLKSLGFGQWQRSIYVSPYDFNADIVEFLKIKHLYGFAWVLTCQHEYLPDPKTLAQDIWPLDKINQNYHLLLKEIKKSKQTERKYYEEYISILLQDPLLPNQLLPDPWWANEVRQLLLGLT